MTFSLLYVRFGMWGTDDRPTKQDAIDAAINGSDYEQIYPVAIVDQDAKTFEILRTSTICNPSRERAERYLLETTGEQFSFAGDLWIERDDDE